MIVDSVNYTAPATRQSPVVTMSAADDEHRLTRPLPPARRARHHAWQNLQGVLMPYVTTADEAQLYYKDWGRGRPVVLLHGWPLSADSWEDQALAFAEAGYRVIAYDRRGFGRSSQPWDGYDYDTLTDDLASVLQHCHVSEASLFGFSMGGGEVARYMTKYSGAGIVQAGLIASIVPYKLKTPDNPNGTDEKVLDETRAAIKEDRASFFAEFFKKFYGVG